MAATSTIKTVLIIGGTSGIGESFARRFHQLGKKVILTARREAHLARLKKDLPGLETYTMDNADLPHCRATSLTTKYPEIDTVWVNSGIQYSLAFKDEALIATDATKIAEEIVINVTASAVLARLFIPYLIASGSEANFLITSSGLAYVPMGTYPVYCPTKSFIHSFLVGLRQQLAGSNVNVLEIAPPYVATDLDVAHKKAGAGGPPPMPLQEYTDKTFAILESEPAKGLKEVAVGFAAMGVDAWRKSIGTILEDFHLGG